MDSTHPRAGWLNGVGGIGAIAVIGIFAWALWLVAAGACVLFSRERTAPVTGASQVA